MDFSSTTERVLETDSGPVVRVSFCGYYPPGSEGNDVSGAMRKAVEEAVKEHSPSGVVLDISGLDYVWGNDILGIFLPLDKGGYKDFISSCVVAKGKTARAFKSLLAAYSSSIFDMAKSKLVDDVNEAVEVVKRRIAAGSAGEDAGDSFLNPTEQIGSRRLGPVMTREAAMKHVKHAWVAGVALAVLIVFEMIYEAVVGSTDSPKANGLDWWVLIDVAIVLSLTFGIRRNSRLCAVFMLTYWMSVAVSVAVISGSTNEWPIAAIFAYLFVQGVRGTFAYHSGAAHHAPSGQRRTYRRWLWRIVGIVAVIVTGFSWIAVYLSTRVPGAAVIPGEQLADRFLARVQELGVLEEGERIQFFYSDGVFDMEEGFYILTDRKVIIYKREDDPQAMRISFSQIEDLEVVYLDSYWEDSMVIIALKDDTLQSSPPSTEDKIYYFGRWCTNRS